jgi:hypothetical protein
MGLELAATCSRGDVAASIAFEFEPTPTGELSERRAREERDERAPGKPTKCHICAISCQHCVCHKTQQNSTPPIRHFRDTDYDTNFKAVSTGKFRGH